MANPDDELGVPVADAPAKPKNVKPPPEPKVGMLDLLQFATALDWLCISLAIPFAMLTGFLQVSFFFIFGPLFDSLGTTQAAGAFASPEWGPCCGISMPLWWVQISCFCSHTCSAALPPLPTATQSTTALAALTSPSHHSTPTHPPPKPQHKTPTPSLFF
jgi:hypothetical protein